MLGEFRVLIGDDVIPSAAWEHRRAADLVKLLGLAPEHRLVRDQILALLWPQLDATSAAAALHKAASHARRALRQKESIVLRQGDVLLAPALTIATDVAAFERAARDALASRDITACARAAAAYSGELLPSDRYGDWCAEPRERLARLHLELLRAQGAWEQIVALDPLDERAHLALMRMYAAAGERAAALRQYRRLQTALAERLGVAPAQEAVALYAQISRGPAVQAPIAAAHPLIGREVELARARTLLRKVAAGRGHTLLVRGDPGIGKTRWCEAVLAEAAASGASTLRGAARGEGAVAYGPLIEALDRLLLERPELALSLAEPARGVLARLALPVPGDLDREAKGAPLGRQAVFSAVNQLLSLASKERPVLLFLDDLHAADESTLQLVHYVAELVRFHPILLLAASRSGSAPALDRLRSVLAGQRAATEIDLGPLTHNECRRLITRVTGDAPPASVVDGIHARTAGNALFTELIAASLDSDHALVLPDALHLVLDGLLARAGEAVQRVLERVAVLGDEFSAEELLAVSDESEAETFELLDRALSQRLVDERPGSYRFHHGLLREALLQRMPQHRRRQAHRRAARGLGLLGAAATRVASQLLEAGANEEALPWLAQAAREEERVGAYANAIRFVELALQQGAPSPELLALRADLVYALGDSGSPAAYERALLAAPAQARPVLLVKKSRAQMSLGDDAGAYATLDGVAAPQTPDELALYLTVHATLAWVRGDLGSARASEAQLRELARATGDLRVLTEAVIVRGMVSHGHGTLLEDIKSDLLSAEHAKEVAVAIHEGHLCMLETYLYGGEPYSRIAQFARELLRAAEHAGARRAMACASCLLGEAELLSGALGPAEQHLERAANLSFEVGSLAAAALALQRRAEAQIAAGAREPARALLDRALQLGRENVLVQRHVLQRIYGARIDAAEPGEAAAIVDEAEVAIVGPGEGCQACLIALAVPAAKACARCGDLERAERYLGSAAQMADLFWRGGGWHAAVAEARAVLWAARGEPARASAEWRRASELFRQTGQRLDMERCARACEP